MKTQNILSILIISIFIMFSCGGGSGGDENGVLDPDSQTNNEPEKIYYNIWIEMTGFSRNDAGVLGTITLQNNGQGTIDIDYNNSTNVFKIEDKSSYNIKIISSPDWEDCDILNEVGVVDGEDITNVRIRCIDKGHGGVRWLYTIGGEIFGATGPLTIGTIQEYANGVINKSYHLIEGSGKFTYKWRYSSSYVPYGHGDVFYDLLVFTPPVGQECTVTNGSGKIEYSDVTNIKIFCQ